MGRKKADLQGEVYGKLRVVALAETCHGTKASWWVTECLGCGSFSTRPASAIKRNKTGCAKCASSLREYKIIETECQRCGEPMQTESRHPHRFCSVRCRALSRNATVLEERRESVEGTLKKLVYQTRSRAKKKGIEHDIDFEYLLSLLETQEGRCAGTGWELIPSETYVGGLRNTSPEVVSIDRVDSKGGYTKGNVALVSYAYNVAKNKYTEEFFINMCKDVLTKAGYVVSGKEGRVHEG